MQGLRPLPRKYVETGHVQLHSDMCFKCFKMNQSFITCIKIINENNSGNLSQGKNSKLLFM